MKRVPVIAILSGLMAISVNLAARSSIGGFNVYYGHLHNHCNISDGRYSPDYAYQYAKTTGGLDFFSLADHSTTMSPAEWTAMKTAADKYNEPGVYTTFWGFEWTNYDEGHVAVINSADYISTEAPTHTFIGLCSWLDRNECVAFFNHPGQSNESGIEFRHFSSTPCSKIIGIELWNKSRGFKKYYYTDGYYPNDGNIGYYDEALSRGWMVGAAGSEDNHIGNWGSMTESKLALLAPANNRAELMKALMARRFYSTADKDLALSFKIGGNEMGSTVSGGFQSILIQAADDGNEIFTRVELLRNGFVIGSWTPNITNPCIQTRMNCLDGEYYFVRVMQEDGDEAISSPVHISGGLNNLPPVMTYGAPAISDNRPLVFDFTRDYDGWSGDFADYPAGDSAFYELEFRRTALPAPLDTSKHALKIGGSNHSDDLFMFIKRKITGLLPIQTYRVRIDVELASEAPTHAVGIGGAPGESVFLKAGATLVEPRKVASDGFYLMNIDKSNQASPGADMDTIGHIGVSDTTTVFTLINRSNASHLFTISTNDDGAVWICIGTDSGFEGITTLYYNKITLSFDAVTGKEEVPLEDHTVVYPNPATDILFIRNDTRKIKTIELFNMNGLNINTIQNSDRISLRNLDAGIYPVRITFENNSVIRKKIIIR